MGRSNNNKKVFVSYRSTDLNDVRVLVKWLKKQKINHFFFEAHVEAGQRMSVEIDQAIDKCNFMIVCIGPSGGFGPVQACEVDAGFNRQKELIPLQLPNAPRPTRLPFQLEGLRALDFRAGWRGAEREFERLAKRILDDNIAFVYPSSEDMEEAERLRTTDEQRFAILEGVENDIANIRPSVSTRWFTKSIFDRITDFARRLLGVDYCSIVIPETDYDGDYMYTVSRSPKDLSRVLHDTGNIVRPKGEKLGLTYQAWRDKCQIIVDDVLTDPRYVECYRGIRSELVTPVAVREKVSAASQNISMPNVIAVLNLESILYKFFTEKEQQLVKVVVSQIVAAQLHATLKLLYFEARTQVQMSQFQALTTLLYNTDECWKKLLDFKTAMSDFLQAICKISDLSLEVHLVVNEDVPRIKRSTVDDLPLDCDLNDTVLATCLYSLHPPFLAAKALGDDAWDMVALSKKTDRCIGLVPIFRQDVATQSSGLWPAGPSVILAIEGPGGEEAGIRLAHYLLRQAICGKNTLYGVEDYVCGEKPHKKLCATLPAEASLWQERRKRTVEEDSKSLESKRAEYRARVSRHATRGLQNSRISLADLVPGVCFREIWPLYRAYWTPLKPYHRPEEQERIPSRLLKNPRMLLDSSPGQPWSG